MEPGPSGPAYNSTYELECSGNCQLVHCPGQNSHPTDENPRKGKSIFAQLEQERIDFGPNFALPLD